MPESVTLVDAHVHLRDVHEPGAVLDGAVAHFARSAMRLGARECEGVLMLAEAAGEHGFDRLAASERGIGRWRIEMGREPNAVRARRDDDQSLWIFNGRQVATREGLEVLTLLSGVEIEDGLGVRETIERGLEAGALVTLPWGFGKWTGGRKKLMAELVRAFAGRGVVLGDSAGRPAGLGEGAVFGLGRELGMAVLPGTDPLPIPGHRGRAGRYGLWFEGRLDPERPLTDLRGRVSGPMGADATIGRRDGLLRAVLTQVRLRVG